MTADNVHANDMCRAWNAINVRRWHLEWRNRMRTDARGAIALADRPNANRVTCRGGKYGWLVLAALASNIKIKSSLFWMNLSKISCSAGRKLIYNDSMGWLWCRVLLVSSLQRAPMCRIKNRNFIHFFPTGNITIGSSRGFEEPFYFQLAKQFLGNRIGSYAAYLRFSIAMEECKTALDETILQRFPLVQIHSHDNLILNYFGVSARPHASCSCNISFHAHI